jgi:hypothetical protein
MPFYHLVLSTNNTLFNERVTPLEKVIGSSKVQPNNRITLIRNVQKKLNVKVGDMIVFVEDEKGNVMIKKGQLKTV